MTRTGEELNQGVVKQVLGYFVSKRKTADTLEGIARWRLLEERVQRSLQQTEAAVGWLVHEEYLEEVMLPGAKAPIFRLNPRRRNDAIRFLQVPDKKSRMK